MLVVKNVNKAFHKQVVLKDFSFTLEPHTITAIAGRSGSGKSTILNIVGLLDRPDQGTVELFGKVNPKLNSKAVSELLRYKIGYLFQNFALIEHFSVEKNLRVAMEYGTYSDVEYAMKKAIKKVGLPVEILDKKVYQCSGGEQQRIAIARLLLKPCELILADEPTGSLDEKNRNLIFDLLLTLKEEGKTILMVTHDPYLISQCDHVIEL